LTVDVPAGATHLTKWRIKGKGHDGTLQSTPGDLAITLSVAEHRVFHRSGNDLHIATPVPLSVALLGGMVSVPTLKGPRQLSIPAGTQTGQMLSVQGCGAPFEVGGVAGHGSLRVHVVVVVPKGEHLSGRQKGCLRIFADPGADNAEETPATLKMKFASWLRPEPEPPLADSD
jgi:molecular chaperone DnaJ